MIIGTSTAVTVVLILVVGTFIYKKLRRTRQTSETPPVREPSSSGEIGPMRNSIELDILS